MKIPPGKVRNRPTELGAKLGAEVARLCDDAEQTAMTLHPRCTTCAFRLGTVPNCCEATVMDALKCAMEGEPKFMCHERPGKPCSGWMMMRAKESVKVPWPFSNDDSTAPQNGEGQRE
jgi:hypothetical protein